MNLDYLCMGCMKEKTEWTPICPHCGYDGVNTQNDSSQLPTWTMLNNTYLVGKSLGKGGFGMTYLAFDVNLQKKVVIKEYFLGQCSWRQPGDMNVYTYDGEKAKRFNKEKASFVEEARILAQIDEQPGIVKVISYFEANNTAYIVMEYLEGESLKKFVMSKGGYLPANQTIELMKPVIKALAGIHQKGVVHRDISPDNIMITTKGKLKLIDFGAAKDSQGDFSADKVFKKTYSPLEQRVPEGIVGPYSDIYALCATMYQMITGRKVPPATERINSDGLIPPSALGIQINPIHEAALINGLAVDSTQRIKNATDLYYFMYVYGNEQNASNEGMQKKMHDSSTEVIVEKLKRENSARRSRMMTSIAMAVVVVLGCLMIAFNKFAADKKDKDNASNPTENIVLSEDDKDKDNSSDKDKDKKTTEEATGENDTVDVATKIKDCRDKVYELIKENNENPLYEVDSDYESYESEVLDKVLANDMSKISNVDEALAFAGNIVAEDKAENYPEAGYVMIVSQTYQSSNAIYKSFAQQVEEINNNTAEDIKKEVASNGSEEEGEQAKKEFLENAVNLNNCTRAAISAGVDTNGYYYWLLMYR